jgi:hypothetical protein
MTIARDDLSRTPVPRACSVQNQIRRIGRSLTGRCWSGVWLALDIYSQVPVNDIAAIKPVAASSQSCKVAKLKANRSSPFFFQTE